MSYAMFHTINKNYYYNVNPSTEIVVPHCRPDHWEVCFWGPRIITFSNVATGETSPTITSFYFYHICNFDRSCIVYLYFYVRQLGTLFLRSLYHCPIKEHSTWKAYLQLWSKLYLCICICVFALQTLGNIVFGHMLSENMCFVWFKLSYSGQKIGCHKRENIRHTYIQCEHRARICKAWFVIFNKC